MFLPDHIEAAYTAAHGGATTGSSWIAGVVALAVFAAAVVAICLRTSGGDDGGGGDPGWGGGGGAGPTTPHGPVDADDGPIWWPEFDRQFAAWVEQSQRLEPVAS